MRKALRFTPDAIASIERIGEYTQENWGIRQRNNYLNALDKSFHQLALKPRLGTDCGQIASGLRRYPNQKHVIYYRVEDDFVTVIHVLHERMDSILHLL